jgi:chemotaxis protein CheC
MTTRYSEPQLDGLRELANIGSGTAATALSQLVGRTIDVSVPNARALPLADAVDAAGPPDSVVTGVVVPVHGDIEAMVLMLYPPADAAVLCELLDVDPDTEVGLSALGEIGNIVGSAYVSALAAVTGLEFEPSPPATATDMVAAVVATVLSVGAHSTDYALLLDSEIVVANAECAFSFMLVPNQTGVEGLLSRLGLAG